MSEPQVLIVGAGVSGLTCARALAQGGLPPRVLDRARGVGGRCATRRVDGQPVDHGAPYLHGTHAPFLDAVRELGLPGLVPGWPREVRVPQLACVPDAFSEGAARWGIEAGLSVLPKALAEGLDVRLGQRVTALEAEGGTFAAITESGERHAAGTLVLAASLAQSLQLLEPLAAAWPEAAAAHERLRRIEVVPVLTVIAGYPLEAPAPAFDLWSPFESTMIQMIVHDSAKRPSPRQRVLVLHARPRLSRRFLEAPPEDWARDLVWEAGDLLGEWAARPAWVQAHRWRSGRVRVGDQLESPVVLHARGGGTLVLAGDAFGGSPGIEGAHRSGLAAAGMLLGRGREAVAD